MSDEIETAVHTNIDITEEWRRPRLVSILFCDSAETTEDGKTNLVGIFDRIYVHPKRRLTPLFTLFVRTAETVEGLTQVLCHAPNGEIPTMVTFSSDSREEFTPNLPANNQGIVHMNPFFVSVEGIYWFSVSFRGQPLGGAGLVIEFRETEDKAGGTDTYV